MTDVAKASQLAQEMSRFEQEILGASSEAPQGPPPPAPPLLQAPSSGSGHSFLPRQLPPPPPAGAPPPSSSSSSQPLPPHTSTPPHHPPPLLPPNPPPHSSHLTPAHPPPPHVFNLPRAPPINQAPPPSEGGHYPSRPPPPHHVTPHYLPPGPPAPPAAMMHPPFYPQPGQVFSLPRPPPMPNLPHRSLVPAHMSSATPSRPPGNAGVPLLATPPAPPPHPSGSSDTKRKSGAASGSGAGLPDVKGVPLPEKAPPGGGKKRRDPKKLRLAGGEVWEDVTLDDWDPNDFRIFCGDLGNDVNDDTLARAFNRYPTFIKAKVIRDRYTTKTKGYGFVSFKDPHDFMQAMREVNGKYIGNRPVKLHKSTWKDRCFQVVKKKDKEKKRLGFR